MDIREYNTRSLPYHFVLFYNMSDKEITMYRGMFNGKPDDNALLTYCYLDAECGLSYRVICCARLYDDETVEFDISENVTNGMIIREGGIECDAILFDEGGIMSRFQEEADFIKDNYGYHEESLKVDEDVPFASFRHVAYPDDIPVYFFSPDQKVEQIWVRETSHESDGTVTGYLINEPYDKSFGVHNGDKVQVIPYEINGEIIPVAVLPWMSD